MDAKWIPLFSFYAVLIAFTIFITIHHVGVISGYRVLFDITFENSVHFAKNNEWQTIEINFDSQFNRDIF